MWERESLSIVRRSSYIRGMNNLTRQLHYSVSPTPNWIQGEWDWDKGLTIFMPRNSQSEASCLLGSDQPHGLDRANE